MLIQAHFSQKYPRYRDMVFYESTRKYAPNLEEPCRCFFIQDEQDQTTYQQIVWSDGYGRVPIVKPVHFIVNESLVCEVQDDLLGQYKGNVQEVGMTQAFGHTLAVTHMSKKDSALLDTQVSEIRNEAKRFTFILNGFDTCEGSQKLIEKMANSKGESLVENMLYQDQNYAVLKDEYVQKLKKQPVAVQQQEVDLKIEEYVRVLTQPPQPVDVFKAYEDFVSVINSDPSAYTKQVKIFQNGSRLLHGIYPQ